jgi:dephospho-CoA kinase
MLVIGLTGGIGSGKSTVAELFRQKAVELIDADVIAREVVAPGEPALQQIAGHFGSEVLDSDGSLLRKKLRELVFADPAERIWLEQLLHPLIHTAIKQRIAACATPYCLLVSPLLLETSQRELVDRILVVDVSRETQLSRTLERDGSPRETVEAIIEAQVSREVRCKNADDIIANDGDIKDLAKQVDRLHDQYLQLATHS